jgi:hypothetical protein
MLITFTNLTSADLEVPSPVNRTLAGSASVTLGCAMEDFTKGEEKGSPAWKLFDRLIALGQLSVVANENPTSRSVLDIFRKGGIDDSVAALVGLGLIPHFSATALASSPVAAAVASAIVRANDLRTKYIAHIASTAAHPVADATNTVTAPAASDQTTVNTLLNELKTDFNAHIQLLASHRGVGGAGTVAPTLITTANASDEGTSVTLANALYDAFNRHVAAAAPAL